MSTVWGTEASTSDAGYSPLVADLRYGAVRDRRRHVKLLKSLIRDANEESEGISEETVTVDLGDFVVSMPSPATYERAVSAFLLSDTTPAKVIRHSRHLAGQRELVIAYPDESDSGAASAPLARSVPWQPSALRSLCLPSFSFLVLGVALLSVTRAAGIIVCWLAMAGVCFANYASARRHEIGWFIGPAVAGFGTLICVLLAVTAAVTAVTS